MKNYEFVALRVKAETHRKVRIAAALAGLGLSEWIDRMVDMALNKAINEPANLPVASSLPEAQDAQPGA